MGKAKTVYDLVPHLERLRDDVLYGDVWEQPELSKRDRSLVTCAMLAALYRTEELKAHIGIAVKNGVTKDEIKGMIVQTAFYAGWPCAVNAGRAALDVFGDDPD